MATSATRCLLPNHNLDAAYSEVDLSVVMRIVPRVRWYVSVENLFNQSYNATFGFAADAAARKDGRRSTFGGRADSVEAHSSAPPHDADDRRVRVRCSRHHCVRAAILWPPPTGNVTKGCVETLRLGDRLLSREGGD